MKNSFKKISLAVCAVLASFTVMATAAFATERPMPGSDDSTTTVVDTTTDQVDTSAGSQVDTSSGTTNTVTNPINNVAGNTSTQSSQTEKKYQTRLGGFLWFLLSVVVNLILSYLIGSRFYQLARKSAQGSGEIRALRKDIEEKFAGTLRDISEPATEIMNSNEDYSRTDEGLAMPERKKRIELNDEEREMMRKWDNRSRVKAIENEDYDEEDEYEEEYEEPRAARRSSRAYRPTRRSSGIDFEDEDDIEEDEFDEYDEYEDRRPSKKRPAKMSSRGSKKSGSKRSGRKKGFSNILRFGDEDR